MAVPEREAHTRPVERRDVCKGAVGVLCSSARQPGRAPQERCVVSARDGVEGCRGRGCHSSGRERQRRVIGCHDMVEDEVGLGLMAVLSHAVRDDR